MSSLPLPATADTSFSETEVEVHQSGSQWQWASVALLFKVPIGNGNVADGKYWEARPGGELDCGVLAAPAIPGGARPARVDDKGAIDYYLRGTGGFKELTTRWFKHSAARGSILAIKDATESQVSLVPVFDPDSVTELLDLKRAGIGIAGISRTRQDSAHEYVVLHFRMTGASLDDPTWLASALHRHTKVEDLALASGERVSGTQVCAAVNFALLKAGLDAQVTHSGSVVGVSKEDFFGQIYTIASAAPKGELPARNCGGHETLLQRGTQWAHALSTAQSPAITSTLSDFSDSGVERSTVSLGPAVAWCSDRGLGIVAQEPPRGSRNQWASEVAHVATLSHSVFVDLAVLVMQQNDFLDRRAKDLSDLASSEALKDLDGQEASGEPGGLLQKYQEIQKRYLGFLGQTWFQEIPRRESATRILQGMQAARHLEERLRQTSLEQDAILSYLASLEQKKRQDAREKAEKNRRKEEARRTKAQDAQEQTSFRISFIAYVFLPVTLVFTITGGLGITLDATGIIVSALIALLLTLLLFAGEFFLRSSKGAKVLAWFKGKPRNVSTDSKEPAQSDS